MFDRSVGDLAARDALVDVAATVRASNLLEARLLEHAAHWADLHAVVADEASLPGTERLVAFGGDGTPEMAEFAPAELGAQMATSSRAAELLIGDALDLRHRLPALWGRVLEGEVKCWAARKVAQTTRHLTVGACAKVDRVIAPYADRKSAGDLVAVAEAEAIRADPQAAAERAETARSARGVWVSPSTGAGTKELFIRAAAGDVIRFDGSVDRIADDLALCGDDSSKDQRRAKAVGILARPQLALELRGQAAALVGEPATATPRFGNFSTTTLYVHLTDATLREGNGLARVEGVGPVVVHHVKEWLQHDKVTVVPVIDLNNQAPLDAYEIPDRLREAVHLAMPTDVFPFAPDKSRRKDIDHTVPFRAGSAKSTGPPGQTRIGNLAPMTRKHHRIKTFGRWKVAQPFPGIVVWRSPHGQHYLVDHTGTRPIDTAA